MAAARAAECGDSVTLIEKNDKLGKKLYISGKGRCNITNDCTPIEFLENVINNPKFLLSAINRFTPSDTMEFCRGMGCEIKTERGNRVFPSSDKSSDFIKALSKYMELNGVKVIRNCSVKDIAVFEGHIRGVETDKGMMECDKVILATGGMSYPGTGSTGDGYTFAKRLGHTIIPLRPALSGMDTVEDVSELTGVSLKNVSLSVYSGQNCLCSEMGEMLFTHTGISGPIVLTLSSMINKRSDKLTLSIDLKPALDREKLDERILRDFNKYNNKELRNALGDLTLKSLIPIIIKRSGIDPAKRVNAITKAERLSLVDVFKGLEFSLKRLTPIEGAIVTSGGVDIKEINPKTMESKLVKGLYFAGEVMDVDALTGGFNIQIALSTGYVAGTHQ